MEGGRRRVLFEPDGDGELAQLGERLVCNQEVTGSSPVFSTSQSSRGAEEAGRPARRVRGDGV